MEIQQKAQTLVSIEHTIGLLKNRFRRLLHTVDASPEFASKTILAACTCMVCSTMCQDDMSYAYILVRVNSYSFIIKFAD